MRARCGEGGGEEREDAWNGSFYPGKKGQGIEAGRHGCEGVFGLVFLLCFCSFFGRDTRWLIDASGRFLARRLSYIPPPLFFLPDISFGWMAGYIRDASGL